MSSDTEIQDIVRARIESLRLKLLDLSRRNPLISTQFSSRSNSCIRVVDEFPDALLSKLDDDRNMRFKSLPGLEEDPQDEQGMEFRDAFANAFLTDKVYLEAIDKIDPDDPDSELEQRPQFERELKDRVRELLNMPPRQTSTDIPSLVQHAKIHGISPFYDLPKPTEQHGDDHHTDDGIQTILLPDDLERKLNGLTTKYRTHIQEVGVNVLHAAFGFLEWSEQNGNTKSFAPLVLIAVNIERRKTTQGSEFRIQKAGEKAETNMVLAEKLRRDFGITLPQYEGGSIEKYLEKIPKASPRSMGEWKVRRQVAFGVFPSARMAMYHDLDTSTGQDVLSQNEVISKIFGGPSTGESSHFDFAKEYEIDQPKIESKVPRLVMDADSSQFSAMVDIADGKNLAVEGPPGTGKSQTIVNVIAAAIAGQKKVLFVAEKAAALNVVKSRLEKARLGEFILPLQAERSAREKVIDSVRDRINMKVLSLSEDYEREVEKFKKIRSQLTNYIEVISSLFEKTGFTIHDIIGKSITTNDILADKLKFLKDLKLEDVAIYDQSRINRLRELGTKVEKAWRKANAARSYWRGHKLLHINRLSVETVQNLSSTTTNAYHSAINARQELSRLACSPETDLSDLKSLKKALGRLLDIQTIKSKLIKDEKILSDLRQFIIHLPESASFGMLGLIEARKLVCSTSPAVLTLRNEMTADPAMSVVMERAIQQGRDLRKKETELYFISTISDIPINDLSTHLAVIANAGLLRFLSFPYQRAKKAYLSISHRPSFRLEHAIADIQSLIKWKESERVFLNDQRISEVFGVHFQGMNTNFDLFYQLQFYYKSIDEQFSGAENREIRNFLKIGDLDLLRSIPEISEEESQYTCGTVGSYVENINLHLPRLRQALNKMESLIDSASDNREKLDIDIKEVEIITSVNSQSNVVLNILKQNVTREALKKVFEAVKTAIEQDQAAEDALSKLSKHVGIDNGHFSDKRSHAEIVEFLTEASKDQDGLYAHSEYFVERKSLEDDGFGWVVESLLEKKLPLTDLGKILEAIAIHALVREVYAIHKSTLGPFKGERLNELRTQLATVDRKIIEMSRERLRTEACQSAKPPPGNSRGRRSDWTEMALLINEINKKQRFVPVRDLTQRARSALFELKPCWMMSPLAVAQYLPLGGKEFEFDLCIIDEASQMPPEDAVGALARCRQVVVVGDTKQLPPTSFFRKIIDDEDADEDEQVLDESILEMASTTFRPGRRLRWHYRSRHSALIKFSNHLIYDDDLIVFPSAKESGSEMAVSLISVPGEYHSGTNSKEARAMVEEALRFMRTNPDLSLGLVTMNQKQRDLLLQELEHSISQNEDASKYIDEWATKNDGLESFFIKNLENVQGDERDVIFIGTVYGPMRLGEPVLQRFGPINGLAGRRRLNVLFSRAKERIVTFSSMKAADIRADENGNPGAYILKQWLEYSATGILHADGRSDKEPDSDFERFVIKQIESMGCKTVPQVQVVGYFVDIGVEHPEWPHGFIMGVECDGATYHSHKSARDRDRLRQEILEARGWYIYRIWSTDWFNDTQAEVKKLRDAIKERLDKLKRTTSRSS